MITIIFPVTSEQGYNNFKQSLVNIADEIQISTNLLCITNNADLYVKCRNLLPTIFEHILEAPVNKYLTVFTEKKKLLNEAKLRIAIPTNEKKNYVFLYNENIVLPTNTIKGLLDNYYDRPKAGFITGHFVEYPIAYKVNDIYSLEQEKIFSDKLNLSDSRLNEIDICFPYGMMTRLENFLDFNWDEDGVIQYGIELRKQGYTNYLNTNIKYKYGENNG